MVPVREEEFPNFFCSRITQPFHSQGLTIETTSRISSDSSTHALEIHKGNWMPGTSHKKHPERNEFKCYRMTNSAVMAKTHPHHMKINETSEGQKNEGGGDDGQNCSLFLKPVKTSLHSGHANA
ncbi:unnamed protein product [Dovyalis caffra]|uniref:Uncharacterized protein n=1 Tax=Dovyalis caffra TaxID=77055 RepID=A0AAV1QZV5_9ROSI|nr:unnamed protein product [Dovyalis caffra]